METAREKDESTEQSNGLGAPSIQKRILERAKRIPKEDREKFPPDFSENLDYYLYGMPKKSP